MVSEDNKFLITARSAVEAALADTASVDLTWIQAELRKESWTLAADALRFASSLVKHLKPRHILEFGSGLSTRVLARAVEALGTACAISSIDHDPEFGSMAKNQFAADPRTAVRLKFQIAPLVARDCGGKLLPVYNISRPRLASRQAADLVIIDGPPLILGGREGTLYQAMDYARPGTVVLLDDAKRSSERAILRRWQESLGDAIEVIDLPRFSKGLAAILVREPIRCDELWPHRTRLTMRELERLIAPDESFILIDHNCWGDQLLPSRRSIPFLERDGKYWGLPPDDETAIRELTRLQQKGAAFVVFSWPAHWWFDYYPRFHKHLRTQFPSVLDNDRVTVFDLREKANPSSTP